MLIVCPSCASEYALDPQRLGEAGRKVRCAVCRTTWYVGRPVADEAAGEGWAEIPDGGRTIEVVPYSTRTMSGHPGRIAPDRNRMRNRLAVAAIALLLLGMPAALGLREMLVRQVPAAASIFEVIGRGVNLVGLDLIEITAAVGDEGGVRVLFIEGMIRSAAPRQVSVPRLVFSVERHDGHQLYRWSVKPPVTELAPGESTRFKARLASPPPDGHRLVASFQAGRGDPDVASR